MICMERNNTYTYRPHRITIYIYLTYLHMIWRVPEKGTNLIRAVNKREYASFGGTLPLRAGGVLAGWRWVQKGG